MIFINIIIAFLFGIIFIQWIFPLVDGILGVILTQFEVWKGHMAVKITKSQQEVEELKINNEQFQQIGFAVMEDEEPND